MQTQVYCGLLPPTFKISLNNHYQVPPPLCHSLKPWTAPILCHMKACAANWFAQKECLLWPDILLNYFIYGAKQNTEPIQVNWAVLVLFCRWGCYLSDYSMPFLHNHMALQALSSPHIVVGSVSPQCVVEKGLGTWCPKGIGIIIFHVIIISKTSLISEGQKISVCISSTE